MRSYNGSPGADSATGSGSRANNIKPSADACITVNEDDVGRSQQAPDADQRGAAAKPVNVSASLGRRAFDAGPRRYRYSHHSTPEPCNLARASSSDPAAVGALLGLAATPSEAEAAFATVQPQPLMK